jgi:hypothetical protein
MLNDPLLPPPVPVTARSSERTADKAMPTRTSATRRTAKKPATAAKILVTGLSATAVIGMASGYTLAGKTKAQQVNQPVIAPTESVLQPQQVSAQSAASTITPAPAVVPQQSSAAQTPAPVVVVPVPQATPATPGTTTNNWQQQQSSGSR